MKFYVITFSIFVALLCCQSAFAAGPINKRDNHPHPHPIVPVTAIATETDTVTSIIPIYTTDSLGNPTTILPTTTPVGKRKRSEKRDHPHPHPHPHPTPRISSMAQSTITQTITTSTIVVIQPTCTDPVGWNWAHYASPYDLDNTENITLDVYKTETPDGQGITNFPFIQMPNTPNDPSSTNFFYEDQTPLNADLYFLDHKSYMIAPTTGKYTFTFMQIDNIVDLWLGENAITGWERTNANFDYDQLLFSNDDPLTYVTTNNYTKGEYIPIRISLINYGGPSSLQFTITDSNNVQVPNSAFVQYGCRIDDDAPPYTF